MKRRKIHSDAISGAAVSRLASTLYDVINAHVHDRHPHPDDLIGEGVVCEILWALAFMVHDRTEAFDDNTAMREFFDATLGAMRNGDKGRPVRRARRGKMLKALSPPPAPE